MHISRKILIAALALGTVAIQAGSAPASAATETTTMSIGLTITAPSNAAAPHVKAAGAQRNSIDKATTGASRSAKTNAAMAELTTHRIANAHSDTVVVTLSY